VLRVVPEVIHLQQLAVGLGRDDAEDDPLVRFVVDDLPPRHHSTIANPADSACTLAA
jgi:hypothetical protein